MLGPGFVKLLHTPFSLFDLFMLSSQTYQTKLLFFLLSGSLTDMWIGANLLLLLVYHCP